jgi:hypothetical protein
MASDQNEQRDPTSDPSSEPLRETIVIARGPNVHGHHHQVVAAQAADDTKRELAMRAAEETARTGVPVRGLEVGEGDEEGITDASSPAEER